MFKSKTKGGVFSPDKSFRLLWKISKSDHKGFSMLVLTFNELLEEVRLSSVRVWWKKLQEKQIISGKDLYKSIFKIKSNFFKFHSTLRELEHIYQHLLILTFIVI